MGFFNWGRKATNADQVYSVMNDDHVDLYRIVAELRDGIAIQVRGGTERGFQQINLLGTIQKLIDKARAHFQREEALMAEYGYPDARAHRSEHLMLLRSIETYHANLASGGRPITDEVVKYLKAWLTNHIRTTDRQLDRFLVSAAKKAAPGGGVISIRGGKRAGLPRTPCCGPPFRTPFPVRRFGCIAGKTPIASRKCKFAICARRAASRRKAGAGGRQP